MKNNPIDKRLSNLRKKLNEKGLDAAIVTKRENYLYLSGFTGTSAVLIISQDSAVLLTDFRYVEQAAVQAPLYEIIQYHGSIIEAINTQIKNSSITNLGFEEGYITYDRYEEFKEKLSLKSFSPLGGIIESLRAVKDGEELDIIKKAVEIADSAFDNVLKYIKPGVKEIEIAAEIEYHMKKLGAKGASFETIVASGERASMPHGVASEKVIELGDVITLDYGAVYNDYCSDMTRTVFLGEPKQEIKKIYNIVLDAQIKASESIKSGFLGKDIDKVARDIIGYAGFEKNFGHGLGHGVGIEVHEEPRLSPTGTLKLEAGMVVTVEPGIYIPNLGGVRIEDMVVVENDGLLVLTKSTKEIIVI